MLHSGFPEVTEVLTNLELIELVKLLWAWEFYVQYSGLVFLKFNRTQNFLLLE